MRWFLESVADEDVVPYTWLDTARDLALWAVIFIALFLISRFNYPLFHSFADTIITFIAAGVFVVVWNRRHQIDNHFYLFIGVGFVFFALLNFFHLLGNQGMGVFSEYGNLGPTFYIAGRYFLAASFLIAPVFIRRKLNLAFAFVVYAVVATVAFLSIFYWHNFPATFETGIGPTGFKIFSDYLTCCMFATAIGFLFLERSYLDPKVYRYTVYSLAFSIVSGLIFSQYTNPFGVTNTIGHFFEIWSFWLMYVAFVETTILKPSDTLFRNLTRNNERISILNSRLKTINIDLHEYIREREQATAALHSNEEVLRLALEAGQQGAWELDISTGKVTANARMFEIFGMPQKDDATTDDFFSLIQDEDKSKVLEAIVVGQAGTGRYKPEYRIRRRDTGEERWIRTEGMVRCDPSGKPVSRVGIVRDVTEQKRTEEALRLSEEKFATAFAGNPAAIALTDLETGTFLDVNDTWTDLTGYSREEAIGQSSTNISIWLNREERSHYREELEKNGVIRNREYTFLKKSGTRFTAHVSSQILTISGRKSILSTLIDVSNTKRAELALKKSEERARLLVKFAPSMIYEVDYQTSMFQSVNELMCLKLGYSREELLSMKVSDVLTKESVAIYEDRRRGYLANEHVPDSVEYTFVAKDGNHISIVINVAFIDERENRAGAVVVAHDITELKRAEAAKNNFISVLAHELRNPLSPLLSSIEMLGHLVHAGQVTEMNRSDMKEFLEIADRQVKNMSRLLDDLLDISRLANNKVELKKEHVDVNAIARRAVDSSREQIEIDGHAFSLSLPDAPLMIDADPVRIEQIIVNLLKNAAKFTSRGGNIFLAVSREGNDAVIRVKDDGIGIEKEVIEDIFKPYFQIEASRTRSRGGLGLGLMLVKNFCELHGGSIQVESGGTGTGTEFIVRLPALQSAIHAPKGPSQRKYSGAQSRILVVDDNQQAASAMAKLLRLLGHEIRESHDGAKAIDCVDEFNPHVVLLDIGLPDMDGFQVARTIREKYGKQIVIAALTGYGQEDDRSKAKESGFDFHLVKPVSLQGVLDVIEDAGKRMRTRELA